MVDDSIHASKRFKKPQNKDFSEKREKIKNFSNFFFSVIWKHLSFSLCFSIILSLNAFVLGEEKMEKKIKIRNGTSSFLVVFVPLAIILVLCFLAFHSKFQLASAQLDLSVASGEKGEGFRKGNLESISEDGSTDVLYFSVSNNGEVDFSYDIDIEAKNCGKEGNVEYILLTEQLVNTFDFSNYESLVTNLNTQPKPLKEEVQEVGSGLFLKANDIDYFALIIHINDNSKLNGKEISVNFIATATRIVN